VRTEQAAAHDVDPFGAVAAHVDQQELRGFTIQRAPHATAAGLLTAKARAQPDGEEHQRFDSQ
jgi:hypothetical protein